MGQTVRRDGLSFAKCAEKRGGPIIYRIILRSIIWMALLFHVISVERLSDQENFLVNTDLFVFEGN